MNPDIGIIGGTGVYDPEIFEKIKSVNPTTPYGEPSDEIEIGKLDGKVVAFVPRHGKGHKYPPHNLPYRANIHALKKLGVKRILAPQSVGSLRKELEPGTIVLPDQFVDNTRNRNYTFYDKGKVAHISTAEPFCDSTRNLIHEKSSVKTSKDGTYVCIEGPRFSTKAESQTYRSNGYDIIGMTLVPEAILAKEKELCYTPISMVTDYDCWYDEEVSAEMVKKTAAENVEKVKSILKEIIPIIPESRNCDCKNSLKGATL